MASLADRWDEAPILMERFASQQEALGLERTVLVSCAYCLRFKGSEKCDAFPGGIPKPILQGIEYHLKPYENDNGLQFLPIDDSMRRMVEGWAASK